MSKVFYYQVDEIETIAIKNIMICNQSFIIFIDVKTDGMKISHTIKANFSKKNIIDFLSSKFKSYKQL